MAHVTLGPRVEHRLVADAESLDTLADEIEIDVEPPGTAPNVRRDTSALPSTTPAQPPPDTRAWTQQAQRQERVLAFQRMAASEWLHTHLDDLRVWGLEESMRRVASGEADPNAPVPDALHELLESARLPQRWRAFASERALLSSATAETHELAPAAPRLSVGELMRSEARPSRNFFRKKIEARSPMHLAVQLQRLSHHRLASLRKSVTPFMPLGLHEAIALVAATHKNERAEAAAFLAPHVCTTLQSYPPGEAATLCQRLRGDMNLAPLVNTEAPYRLSAGGLVLLLDDPSLARKTMESALTVDWHAAATELPLHVLMRGADSPWFVAQLKERPLQLTRAQTLDLLTHPRRGERAIELPMLPDPATVASTTIDDLLIACENSRMIYAVLRRSPRVVERGDWPVDRAEALRARLRPFASAFVAGQTLSPTALPMSLAPAQAMQRVGTLKHMAAELLSGAIRDAAAVLLASGKARINDALAAKRGRIVQIHLDRQQIVNEAKASLVRSAWAEDHDLSSAIASTLESSSSESVVDVLGKIMAAEGWRNVRLHDHDATWRLDLTPELTQEARQLIGQARAAFVDALARQVKKYCDEYDSAAVCVKEDVARSEVREIIDAAFAVQDYERQEIASLLETMTASGVADALRDNLRAPLNELGYRVSLHALPYFTVTRVAHRSSRSKGPGFWRDYPSVTTPDEVDVD